MITECPLQFLSVSSNLLTSLQTKLMNVIELVLPLFTVKNASPLLVTAAMMLVPFSSYAYVSMLCVALSVHPFFLWSVEVKTDSSMLIIV